MTTDLVAVNNRNLVFLNSGGQESKIKILAGLVPSGCKNLFHVFLLVFGGCLKPLACGYMTLISAFVLL